MTSNTTTQSATSNRSPDSKVVRVTAVNMGASESKQPPRPQHRGLATIGPDPAPHTPQPPAPARNTVVLAQRSSLRGLELASPATLNNNALQTSLIRQAIQLLATAAYILSNNSCEPLHNRVRLLAISLDDRGQCWREANIQISALALEPDSTTVGLTNQLARHTLLELFRTVEWGRYWKTKVVKLLVEAAGLLVEGWREEKSGEVWAVVRAVEGAELRGEWEKMQGDERMAFV